MTSKVSICNLALSNIGSENITTLDEARPEARACKQYYDQTLATMLEAYPWRFAEATIALAEVTNTKAQRWGKAFRRPSDCRKIRRLTNELMLENDDAQGLPYAIEGTTIFTDVPVAYLEYTQDITDPSRFPALFVEALAWNLSVKLAMPLTRDAKVRADAWQVADQMTIKAQVADANQQRTTTDIRARALEARA